MLNFLDRGGNLPERLLQFFVVVYKINFLSAILGLAQFQALDGPCQLSL
jgi:hypothetical protein